MKYNYSATSSGVGLLEFGFFSKDYRQIWRLDDFSLQDVNASNAEQLRNGNFENGTLVGWQMICPQNSQASGSSGKISTTVCHNGSYCYQDSCEDAYDFLRQTFPTVQGHSYTLSFWLISSGDDDQKAFVRLV